MDAAFRLHWLEEALALWDSSFKEQCLMLNPTGRKQSRGPGCQGPAQGCSHSTAAANSLTASTAAPKPNQHKRP